jgi:hypothetical protein
MPNKCKESSEPKECSFVHVVSRVHPFKGLVALVQARGVSIQVLGLPAHVLGCSFGSRGLGLPIQVLEVPDQVLGGAHSGPGVPIQVPGCPFRSPRGLTQVLWVPTRLLGERL